MFGFKGCEHVILYVIYIAGVLNIKVKYLHTVVATQYIGFVKLELDMRGTFVNMYKH